MNTWQYLIDLQKICKFTSREKPTTGIASNSELKRWCNNKAIVIDGKRAAWDDEICFPITSLVLFPKHPVSVF